MMWSSDYPHHGNDWPYSRKVIEETMGDIPADEKAKITGGNAARIWGLDAEHARVAFDADRAEGEALQRALVHVLDDAGHEREQLAGRRCGPGLELGQLARAPSAARVRRRTARAPGAASASTPWT